MEDRQKAAEAAVFDQTNLLPKKELLIVFGALAVSLFICFVDQNGIGVALPTIGQELYAEATISWAGTSALIANTLFQVLYGRMSDLFGKIRLIILTCFAKQNSRKKDSLLVSAGPPNYQRLALWIVTECHYALCLPRSRRSRERRHHFIIHDDRLRHHHTERAWQVSGHTGRLRRTREHGRSLHRRCIRAAFHLERSLLARQSACCFVLHHMLLRVTHTQRCPTHGLQCCFGEDRLLGHSSGIRGHRSHSDSGIWRRQLL